MRAGWEYYNATDPEKISPLVEKSKNHFSELESIEATPYDVAAKPEKPGFFGYLGALISWIWVAAWMLGLVTWSAIFRQCSALPSKLSNNVANEETGSIRIYPQYAKKLVAQ